MILFFIFPEIFVSFRPSGWATCSLGESLGYVTAPVLYTHLYPEQLDVVVFSRVLKLLQRSTFHFKKFHFLHIPQISIISLFFQKFLSHFGPFSSHFGWRLAHSGKLRLRHYSSTVNTPLPGGN